MSKPKITSTEAFLFLCLLTASTDISADHNNPLTKFSLEDQQNDKNQHCSDYVKIEASEALCQTQSENDSVFDTKPILSISTQIDIRPESCQSFFDDYLHTRRGLRIESALYTIPIFSNYTETVATFPVIDFINNSNAHVAKSKDLAAQIYSNDSLTNSLFESIVADAEDIEQRFLNVLTDKQLISATVHGKTTTIRAGDITSITLHIVIQAGMATADQINQIRLAKEEISNRLGFELTVIEIP